MIYAILAYHEEAVVESWSKAEDDALMEGLHKVHERLMQEGRLGPAARLGPTASARTVRTQGLGKGVVLDGPFAETKEQLLGLYLVDCDSQDAAVRIAQDLQVANPTAVYEVRPISLYLPGAPLAG